MLHAGFILAALALPGAASAQSADAQSNGAAQARPNIKAQREEAIRQLQSATQSEPRDLTWATQKEAQIQHSFEADGAMANVAKSKVECHSTKCVVLATDKQTAPAGAPAPMLLWAAANEPCGFTAIADEKGSVTQLLIDCKK